MNSSSSGHLTGCGAFCGHSVSLRMACRWTLYFFYQPCGCTPLACCGLLPAAISTATFSPGPHHAMTRSLLPLGSALCHQPWSLLLLLLFSRLLITLALHVDQHNWTTTTTAPPPAVWSADSAVISATITEQTVSFITLVSLTVVYLPLHQISTPI